MAQIIIATHGGLSRGMLDSLHMVAGGAADGIETYSLEFGQNPNDYYEQLRERISASDEQFIIMCDIKGGSVHNALFRLTEFPNVVIFSGLTMAWRSRSPLPPATASMPPPPSACSSAREGVTVCMGGEVVDEEEDEDF